MPATKFAGISPLRPHGQLWCLVVIMGTWSSLSAPHFGEAESDARNGQERQSIFNRPPDLHSLGPRSIGE